MTNNYNDRIIEETDDFVAFDTDHDYDFISIIINKTDKDLCFCPYSTWEEFEVPANDWIGILNDQDGRDTRYALLAEDYDYTKV